MKKILLSLVFLLGLLMVVFTKVSAQTASSSSFLLTGGDFDSFGIATMSGQTYNLSSDSNAGTNWLDQLDDLGVSEDELGNYDSSNFFGNDESALGYTPESLASLFLVQSMNASGSARPSLQLTVDTEAMVASLGKKNPSLISTVNAQEVGALTLSDLPAGSVIDLGDGHPWLWVGENTNGTVPNIGTRPGYGYIMAMYNYGDTTWGTDNQTPTDAINTTADTGTIYTNLPATIGGVVKDIALATNTWQWNRCDSYGTCINTTTSTSRLSFVSATEWQGTTNDIYFGEPSSGSVGNLFYQARGITAGTLNGMPWTRSGDTDSLDGAWSLYGRNLPFSLYNYSVTDSYGSSPVAWLSSSIPVNSLSGAGTYNSPYTLGAASVETEIPIESTASGVVSTASAQVLLLAAVTPGIFSEALLHAQVTTQGLQNSGYSLYTSATQNFLNPAYLQELAMTSCDAGDCTISQATPWENQEVVGVGYTASGEDALADFAGGANFRPFANQSAGEDLQSVATNNSTNDQVARQTTLKIRVSVPGNFPAGNYESALNFMALPNL